MSGFSRRVNSDPAEWRRAMHGYLASVSFADAAIGHILQGLETSGLADDTIVILWGITASSTARKTVGKNSPCGG